MMDPTYRKDVFIVKKQNIRVENAQICDHHLRPAQKYEIKTLGNGKLENEDKGNFLPNKHRSIFALGRWIPITGRQQKPKISLLISGHNNG